MAATNINRVVLTGNLTRDPELRACRPAAGVQPADRVQHAPQGSGEWVDKPNYFSVTVWGAQGENAALPAKGRPVAIDGRLEWREWTDKDGNKRESVEIVADSVQFLGGRRRRRGGGYTAARGAGNGFAPHSTSRRTRRTSCPAGRRAATPPRRTTTSRSAVGHWPPRPCGGVAATRSEQTEVRSERAQLGIAGERCPCADDAVDVGRGHARGSFRGRSKLGRRCRVGAGSRPRAAADVGAARRQRARDRVRRARPAALRSCAARAGYSRRRRLAPTAAEVRRRRACPAAA